MSIHSWHDVFLLVKASGKYSINFITNALFIPTDAKHPKGGIEFMKFYTSPEGQAITNASGRPPLTIAVQEAVSNKLVNNILETNRAPNSIDYAHIQNLSLEINVFIEHMISAVCSGVSFDNIHKKLEKLSLEALEDKK